MNLARPSLVAFALVFMSFGSARAACSPAADPYDGIEAIAVTECTPAEPMLPCYHATLSADESTAGDMEGLANRGTPLRGSYVLPPAADRTAMPHLVQRLRAANFYALALEAHEPYVDANLHALSVERCGTWTELLTNIPLDSASYATTTKLVGSLEQTLFALPWTKRGDQPQWPAGIPEPFSSPKP